MVKRQSVAVKSCASMHLCAGLLAHCSQRRPNGLRWPVCRRQGLRRRREQLSRPGACDGAEFRVSGVLQRCVPVHVASGGQNVHCGGSKSVWRHLLGAHGPLDASNWPYRPFVVVVWGAGCSAFAGQISAFEAGQAGRQKAPTAESCAVQRLRVVSLGRGTANGAVVGADGALQLVMCVPSFSFSIHISCLS